MDLNKIIDYAMDQNASDIHISIGMPVFLRIHGTLQAVGQPFTALQAENVYKSLPISDGQRNRFIIRRQLDFAFHSNSNHRVRGNIFYIEKGLSFVFRLIPDIIPEFSFLGFPNFVRDMLFTNLHGLILIVGPTGQGKSTTLAALLNERSKYFGEHILMLEDPIEYIIPSQKSIVCQREIGRDVLSFSDGIEAAMREDPDVLMVGELREQNSIEATLRMAETGHLVFGTMHTNNAVHTISRLLYAFPVEEQGRVRSKLADSLTMIISQRLLPLSDGKGRCLAFEILYINQTIQSYILQDKINQIPNAIETDNSGKMILFEQTLVGLFMEERITKEMSYRYATDKARLASLFELNGIEP